MGDAVGTNLVLETEPKPEDVRLLEDRIYEFNVQATGISDGKLVALFLRDNNGAQLVEYMAGHGELPASSATSTFRPTCAIKDMAPA